MLRRITNRFRIFGLLPLALAAIISMVLLGGNFVSYYKSEYSIAQKTLQENSPQINFVFALDSSQNRTTEANKNSKDEYIILNYTAAVAAILLFLILAVYIIYYVLKQKKKLKGLVSKGSDIKIKEYEATLLNINEGIVVTDNKGVIRHSNPEVERLTGWSEAELKGSFISDKCVLIDEHTRQPILRTPSGRKPESLNQALLLSKDNVEIPVYISEYPIKNETGDVFEILHVLQDITSEQNALKSLEISEKSFKGLFNSISIAIYLLDKEGKFVDVNQGAVEMYGYPREEFLGKTPEFLSAPGLNDMEATVNQIIKAHGGEAQRFNYWGLRKNGEIFPKDVRLYKGTFFNDDIVIALGIDLTEQKRTKDELFKSEERYRTLYNVTPVGIMIEDSNGTILEVNEEYCKIFGYKHEELIGKPVHFLAGEKNHKKIQENIDSILSGKTLKHEVKSLTKHGDLRVSELNETKISLPGGEDGIISIANDITERKLAEESLRESLTYQELLREVTYNFLNVTIDNYDFIVNKTLGSVGKFTQTDRAHLFVYDFAQNTIRNTNEWCREGIAPEFDKLKDMPIGNYQEWVDAHKSGETIYIPDVLNLSEGTEYRNELESRGIKTVIAVPIIHKSNCYGYVSLNNINVQKNLTDKEEHLLNVLASLLANTHARIDAEKALRDSEEKFRHIVETTYEGIAIVDSNYDITFANKRIAEMVEYSIEELLTKNLSEIIYVDDLDDFYSKRKERFKGISEVFERRFVTKSGKVIWVLASASPYLDKTGAVAGAISMYSDITDRKAAQEKIQQLSKGVEQSSASIVITDKDGKIEYVNKKFIDVTGYTQNEAMGQNPNILRHEKAASTDYKKLWDTIKSGNDWQGEFYNKKKNGEPYWESAQISPIVSDKGEITHFIAIKDDITERKKMEAELIAAKEKAEEMNRIKTYFFANMSHELRTPFVGIMGFAEILSERLADEEEKEMAQAIFTSSSRLVDTLNAILNISKLEVEKTDIVYLNVNVEKVIDDVIKLYHKTVELKKLYIRKEILSSDLIIRTDERMLREILINLINNAIKFTKTGGIKVIVEIESRVDNSVLVIKVQDTGIGIAPDKHNLIWEEFRQVSEGISRSFEGTGLGLTITKRYVEYLRGKISIESKLNEGSTFIIELPLTELRTKKDIIKEIKKTETTVDLKFATKEKVPNVKILYVEDDEFSCDIVTRMLHQYNIILANEAVTAIKLVKENKFDLILMDINLGRGMNGVELTQIIRQNPDYFNTPIVAFTAFAGNNDKEEFLSQGMSHYLSKPFTAKELTTLVNEIFQGK